MLEHGITFIGELPPPFNGVSVKDKLMFERIFRDNGARMIDLVTCKRAPWKTPFIFARVFFAMVWSKAVVIGTGSAFRDKVLLAAQRVLAGRKGMNKVMMIIMGGRYHELVREDKWLRELLMQVGSIWVESEKMIEDMREQGIERAYLFPNCRSEEGARAPSPCLAEGPIRLVYFAGINTEKGVDHIFKAFDELRNTSELQLDFYGELGENIRGRFLEFVKQHENVRYCGVYDAIDDNVYDLLNQYDVMLRPTEWEGEGVAGALVEAKMAGITAIVSDKGFNTEVVRNDVEGIVIKQPLAEHLAEAIRALDSDRDELMRLKRGAYESRKRYCIGTYKQQLLDCVLHDTTVKSD